MIKSYKPWQKLYFNSPFFLKNIYSSIYSNVVARKKFGPYHKKWIALLKESNYWDNKALKKFQDQIFRNFILEAALNTEFYRKIIEKTSMDLNNVTLDDLMKFPVINKSVVKKNYNEIVNKDYLNKSYKGSTSGTTGSLLTVFVSHEAYQREYAFRWHFFSEFNVKRKDRIAYFIGSKIKNADDNKPPFHIRDFSENGIYYSSFHLNTQNLPHYAASLNKYTPKYIKGYPSAIYSLASFIKKSKIPMYKPEAIFTASEVLHEYQKKVIEEVFQCKILQWYGQVETTLNIQECRYHKLHLMEEYGYLEILRDDGTPADSGESGSAVATGWGNHAFPLIRYDTGDNMTLAQDQTCKCGRTGRIIECIDGRDEDILTTPDGKQIGRLTFIFMAYDNVKESQIIQNSINDIVIKVVPIDEYTEHDKELIIKRMHEYVGDSMNVTIEVVDSIERTASGKFKHVISNLKIVE
jgi:phenylacetate-CoA ligase